jgi:hypothetical protein
MARARCLRLSDHGDIISAVIHASTKEAGRKMGFLGKLKQLFSVKPTSPLLDVAVRCNRCHELIHTQINLHNDLSEQYDGDTSTYYCRKGLVGSGENRCFQQIVIEYIFDANRNLIDRRVEGGQFVDEEGS